MKMQTILGADFDDPAQLARGLHSYSKKRARILEGLHQAENAGDVDAARILRWELGLIELLVARKEGASAYCGRSYESYAALYQFTKDTVEYARKRAQETRDTILKLHYLEFVLLQCEQRGRSWIELQREILETYRQYVDGCLAGAGNDQEHFLGLYIDQALGRVGHLLARPGVLSPNAAEGWAEWLFRLAENSRDFPSKNPEKALQQRHRWVADYLAQLVSIPAEAAAQGFREKVVALLREAAGHYQANPLNLHFELGVAQVEADLRKHWGESGTHKVLIQNEFNAVIRRAQFHRNLPDGLLAAHFFREARTLMEKHRQYFTSKEVADIECAEREALDLAVLEGQLKTISHSIEIPAAHMDLTRDTPEETVAALVAQVFVSVPDRVALAADVRAAQQAAPFSSMIPRKLISPGKVVGQSVDEESNAKLDVEQRAILGTVILGAAVAQTVVQAADRVGLTTDHLLKPLVPLGLDAGTMELIRSGCARLIVGDFISATHILIPRIEDVLRQHLKALGVDTTEFRRDTETGTSRTDDASLGALMRKLLQDGRSVREYLGSDVWEHIDSLLDSKTGLNLRNIFAHGLARPPNCTAEVAGITLSVLYLLAEVASRSTGGKVPGENR